MNQPQNTPRQGAARAAGDSKPQKPRHEPPKGHEAFLEALRASGAEVEVWLCSDKGMGTITGKLKSADKFTISLAPDRGMFSGRTLVFFKHAIEMISPVERGL
jgi:sRNA-binding regulator protein Hfq